MSKTKRIVGPFTSEFGTFNPGDACIAVTVCTKNVSVARVTYVGYIERQNYNWQTKQSETMKYAQIRRPAKKLQWFNEETGETCNWFSGAKARWIDTDIVSTLQYNRLLPADTTTDGLIKAL